MTELHFSTVAGVAEAYLCCSCGACAVICPEKAILFKETPGGYCFPSINPQRCTGCGHCLANCAGTRLAVDLPDDPFAGIVQGCWVGKATDISAYKRSQSGGAVTAILLALLAEGKIQGAVTVVMEAGAPPRPRIRIARTHDEMLAAQGSKYCPAPVLNSLEELKEESGTYALVGLSCHVQGMCNILNASPEFSKKINPIIGLICDRILTYGAVDYLLRRSGVKKSEHVSLEYRSKELRGYPGDVKIGFEDGVHKYLPRRERTQIKDYFTPARCRLCFDKMNVLSDITVGDPWGIHDYDKEHGESVVIARTPAGFGIVQSAVHTGQLDLKKIPYDTVLLGQGIDRKRENFASYCRIWSSMNRPLPAQADAALNVTPDHGSKKEQKRNLLRALSLDRFSSRRAMFRDVRKYIMRMKLAKKINKLRPL